MSGSPRGTSYPSPIPGDRDPGPRAPGLLAVPTVLPRSAGLPELSCQSLTQVAPPPREAREAGAGVGGAARHAVVDAFAAVEAGAQGQAHRGCGHRKGRAVTRPGAPGGGAVWSAAAQRPRLHLQVCTGCPEQGRWQVCSGPAFRRTRVPGSDLQQGGGPGGKLAVVGGGGGGGAGTLRKGPLAHSALEAVGVFADGSCSPRPFPWPHGHSGPTCVPSWSSRCGWNLSLTLTGSHSGLAAWGWGRKGTAPPHSKVLLCTRAPSTCTPQRPGAGGGTPPQENRVPEGLTGPSPEDPTPQGHSLQPLQGAWTCPQRPPPACLLSSATTTQTAPAPWQVQLLPT